MDDVEQLNRDVGAERIDIDRLVELIVTLQRQLQAANAQLQATNRQLQAANKRIEELEQKQGAAPTAKIDEPFSLRAEEQRQEARGKSKRKPKKNGRRGRVTTAKKIAQAERTEEVLPEGFTKSECQLSHTRPVWRLEDGRAVLVAYQIFRGPNNRYGKISGVLGRSEFGMEIVVELAHLIHIMGMSFDKACQLLSFFQNLRLRKSQVDALLHQLARHWENEFETLCTLLAHSCVVHADETGWSLNSVWAFLSEKARVLLYGVHKDAETLKQLLDPATFLGLLISDDAAVYANFNRAQKCWAHLLRKAIKLTLQEPTIVMYRAFTDRLLEIYREACRVQHDGRLGDAGRSAKIAALDDSILELCGATWCADLPPLEGLANDYRLLNEELMRLMLAQQLFTFVAAEPVVKPNGETQAAAGTNNEAERTLRNPGQARDTGRTNKTLVGARRQSINMSVMESLRLYLPTFTLSSVTAEIKRWAEVGRSCFTDLLRSLNLSLPKASVLERVYANLSG
jgi:transposase